MGLNVCVHARVSEMGFSMCVHAHAASAHVHHTRT